VQYVQCGAVAPHALFEITNSLIFTTVVVREAITMEALILEVHERNALWNKRNAHYKDRVTIDKQKSLFHRNRSLKVCCAMITGKMYFFDNIVEGIYGHSGILAKCLFIPSKLMVQMMKFTINQAIPIYYTSLLSDTSLLKFL
jgi:hypothetical protein